MSVKLLTDHNLEFLSFQGGCRGSSESTIVNMSNCWKSHAAAHNFLFAERNVKDSGVSMTLDNEVSDESDDKETQELRLTLKELHKQSPKQALQASNTEIASAQNNSAERSVILIDKSSKTKNQEEDKHDGLGTVNQKEMDINRIGIFKKVTVDPGVDTESAGQILSNDQHKFDSKTDACLQNTGQESGLGQIYFQESNGSKTLEIYNNAELKKSISNTPARKGIMKTSS